MRKKTALRAQSRPKMTRAIQDPGLIPKATPSPSAGTKSILENHSHRTPQLVGMKRLDLHGDVVASSPHRWFI